MVGLSFGGANIQLAETLENAVSMDFSFLVREIIEARVQNLSMRIGRSTREDTQRSGQRCPGALYTRGPAYQGRTTLYVFSSSAPPYSDKFELGADLSHCLVGAVSAWIDLESEDTAVRKASESEFCREVCCALWHAPLE